MNFKSIILQKNISLSKTEIKANKLIENGLYSQALKILKISFLEGKEIFNNKKTGTHEVKFKETNNFSSENISVSDLIYQISDTLQHKKFVLLSCAKLAQFLFDNGKKEFAFELMERSYIHDISKLNKDEFYGMATFATDVEAMKNKSVTKPSDEKMLAISLHWSRNTHHPEFHKQIEDMSIMDIAEMCCDWHARSVQFKTNLLEWVNDKLQPRFQFSEDILFNIKEYCSVLVK
jgi:hypothetical protein